MNDSPQRFGGIGRLAVAAVVVLAWITFQLCWMTGHVFGATRFILGDQGSYLYAIGRWQAGEALYRDFAWQYGPLALGWYRAWAEIGGNSPLTLVVAGSLTFAAAWILTARLMVRLAGWRWGGLLAVAGLLPVMSGSGAFALNGPHGAIEMLLLAGCAWSLAAEGNARWRPWQLGVLAGLLQWVRFGPHAAALAAILIIAAWRSWPETTSGREWIRGVGAFAGRLLAAYALVITPLVIWVFMALPTAGAWDRLWPSYMVKHYAATYPHRWPQIASVEAFLVIWLPALVGVGLMLQRLFAGWSRNDPRPRAGHGGFAAGLVFFPLYYLICCTVLFRTDNPMIGHLWLAWPGVALVAGLTSRAGRTVVMALVLPALFGNLAMNWALVQEERGWQSRPVELPNGQQLWFHGDEERHYGALQAALGPKPEGRRLAIMLAGGGIHHFFGTQRVGREWWFLPEFVRPWEEAAVGRALRQHELVLLVDRDTVVNAQLGPQTVRLPLPRTVAKELGAQLRNPKRLDGVGVLLEVVP